MLRTVGASLARESALPNSVARRQSHSYQSDADRKENSPFMMTVSGRCSGIGRTRPRRLDVGQYVRIWCAWRQAIGCGNFGQRLVSNS